MLYGLAFEISLVSLVCPVSDILPLLPQGKDDHKSPEDLLTLMCDNELLDSMYLRHHGDPPTTQLNVLLSFKNSIRDSILCQKVNLKGNQICVNLQLV